MYDLKENYKVQGALICLLLLASLIWRGTSNLSVLLVSYSFIILTFLSFFLLLRSQTTLHISFLSVLFLSWLGWIIIPLAFGWVSNNAIPGFFQCSVWVMAFFIFSMTNSPERLWAMFLKAIWFLALISALYALHQFFIDHAMPCGFFANKNTGSAFLMLAVLLLIGEFIARSYKKESVPQCLENPTSLYNAFLGFSIYILTFVLFISLSRGVVIAFTIGIAFELLLIAKYLPKKRLYLLVFILCLALFSLFIFAQPAISHRLDLLQHEKSRFIIWEGAWHLWQQSPWYGIGIFNFSRYYPPFSLPGDGSSLQYVHNDFLQLLIETGIPGVLILAAIILSLVLSIRAYLKNKKINLETHIKVVACCAALGAFAIHSLVDFNFYVLPMNIILGCCLGYLYSELKKEGMLWLRSFTLSSKFAKGLPVLGFICLLPISMCALNLMMLDHYSQKADFATKQQDYINARKFNIMALKWFDDYEVHSYQADVYFQLANQAQLEAEKNKLMKLLANEINSALEANPSYARPYFQKAMLHAVLQNDSIKASSYLHKALSNNPHFCLARMTYALFFIDQNKLRQAREVLEAGLSYPIPSEYAENYLNYLAKLRAANGADKAAAQVVDRLESMDFYNSDYSDLIV